MDNRTLHRFSLVSACVTEEFEHGIDLQMELFAEFGLDFSVYRNSFVLPGDY